MASRGKPLSLSYPVVVNCLSTRTTKETLFHRFKEFGLIIPDGVTIMTYPNGKSKCFGYVNYKEENAARNASGKMNGEMIDDSIISTLYKGESSKEAAVDYQRLTDCTFFSQNNCTKPRCAYRHVNIKGKAECISWKNRTCKNINCMYGHPPVKKEFKGKEPPRIPSLRPLQGIPAMADFKENTPVDVTINEKNYHAIVRWCGVIPELGDGKLVGIELDQPIPEGCDGAFLGKRYFSCPINCGCFVNSSLCKLSEHLSTVGVADKKSSGEVYICGYYLDNRCVNYEKCNNYHPPYRLPYCWIYKDLNGATKICPKKKDLEIEKAFCQADKKKYISVDLQVTVQFDKLFVGVYKGETVTFSRISTESSMKGTKEPYSTEWCWYYLDQTNVWSLYLTKSGTNASSEIESQYQQYQTACQANPVVGNIMSFETDQFQYTLNFETWVQTNRSTRTKRKIRRRPKFFDFTEKPRKDSTSVLEADFPPHWSKVTGSSTVERIAVSNDVRSKIERKFAETLPGQQILDVRELVNKGIYTQYATKKKLMENKGKNVNEKQLWHGTSADLVDHIAHQNFDWRLCKRGAYGSGSYFAKNASYSNGYTTADQQGVKWMFYADVLVGDYAQGASGLKRQPAKENFELYDSCVDNTASPTIHIIFDKDQCYPRYLLQYK